MLRLFLATSLAIRVPANVRDPTESTLVRTVWVRNFALLAEFTLRFRLKINFRVTNKVPRGSRAYLAYVAVGGITSIVPNAITSGKSLKKGSKDSISIAWSDVCAVLTGDTACATQTGVGPTTYSPENLYIAIDTNYPPTFATTSLVQVGIHQNTTR